jgi:hypothetical protein
MGWLFTQGGGLGGLALGYLLAAPSGRPNGEQGAPANTGSSCCGEAGGFGPAWLRSPLSMSSLRHNKTGLPDFTNKLVSVSIAGEDDGRCLEHLRWETQGGRRFLVGTVPHGGSTNNWCGGIPSDAAWEAVTDYLVFDSAEQYLESLRIYEGKARKR